MPESPNETIKDTAEGEERGPQIDAHAEIIVALFEKLEQMGREKIEVDICPRPRATLNYGTVAPDRFPSLGIKTSKPGRDVLVVNTNAACIEDARELSCYLQEQPADDINETWMHTHVTLTKDIHGSWTLKGKTGKGGKRIPAPFDREHYLDKANGYIHKAQVARY